MTKNNNQKDDGQNWNKKYKYNFIEEWSWKKNQFNKRSKKIKKIRIKLKKISQIGIKWWNWKKNQSSIRNIRTKIRNQKNKDWNRNFINQRTSLKLCTASVNFKGTREKRGGNKKVSLTKNYATIDHMHYFKRKRI